MSTLTCFKKFHAQPKSGAMQCLGCLAPPGEGKERDKHLSKQLHHWHKEEKKAVKLLLLGTGESGKSTITKQMKIIHINGFTDEERRQRATDIRKNLRDSMLTILGAMNILGIPLQDDNNKESVEYMMQVATSPHFDYPQVFYDHVARLWKDPDVRACFQRSSEYQLIDSAKYFLDRIECLRQPSYVPTDQDILRCRLMTNTIQRMDFVVRDRKTDVNFCVFDVGGQQGERRKWIQVFDTATAILFLLDCSSYDMLLREDHSRNRLIEAAEIFEKVWNNRYLSQVSIILFINKIDLLEEKINRGQSFTSFVNSIDKECPYYSVFNAYGEFTKPRESERKEFLESFPRRDPGTQEEVSRKRSRSSSLRTDLSEEVIRTAVFIKRVFMQLVSDPVTYTPPSHWHSQHTCEYYYTCAVDTHTIKKVLEGCRTIIVRKHLERYGIA